MIRPEIFQEVKLLIESGMILSDAVVYGSYRWQTGKYRKHVFVDIMERTHYVSVKRFNEVSTDEQKLELNDLVKKYRPTMTYSDWLIDRATKFLKLRSATPEFKRSKRRRDKKYYTQITVTSEGREKIRGYSRKYKAKLRERLRNDPKLAKAKRIKNNEYQRIKRLNQTPEKVERERARAKAVYAKRKAAGKIKGKPDDEESKRRRKLKSKEWYKNHKLKLSPEQIEERRVKSRERARIKMKNMTPEEKKAYNIKALERRKLKYHSMTLEEKRASFKKAKLRETPEQREQQLFRKRAANMTPEQVEAKKLVHKRWLENMTPEQKEIMRQKRILRAKKYRKNMTMEQRAKGLVENMTPEQVEAKRKYTRDYWRKNYSKTPNND